MNLETMKTGLVQMITRSKEVRTSTLNLAFEFSHLVREYKSELQSSESAADEQRILNQINSIGRRQAVLRRDAQYLSGVINHGQRCLEQVEVGDNVGALATYESMMRIVAKFDAEDVH